MQGFLPTPRVVDQAPTGETTLTVVSTEGLHGQSLTGRWLYSALRVLLVLWLTTLFKAFCLPSYTSELLLGEPPLLIYSVDLRSNGRFLKFQKLDIVSDGPKNFFEGTRITFYPKVQITSGFFKKVGNLMPHLS